MSPGARIAITFQSRAKNASDENSDVRRYPAASGLLVFLGKRLTKTTTTNSVAIAMAREDVGKLVALVASSTVARQGRKAMATRINC